MKTNDEKPKYSFFTGKRLETAAEYNARIAAQKAGLHQSWTGTQAEHSSALDGAKGTRPLTLRGIIAIGVAIIGLPFWICCFEFFNPPTTTKATEAVPVAEVTPVETYRRQSPEFQEALTALRRIQAATQASVSYHDYGQLLIEAKVRVNDAARTLPEGPARDELQAAMEAYVDAGRVWSYKLETNPWFNEDDELAKTLVPKYGLTRDSNWQSSATIQLKVMYSADEALQVIWRAADKHLALLDKLASGSSVSAYREEKKEQQRRKEQEQKLQEQETKIASAKAPKKAAAEAHELGARTILEQMTAKQFSDLMDKGIAPRDWAEAEQTRSEAAQAEKTAKNPQD